VRRARVLKLDVVGEPSPPKSGHYNSERNRTQGQWQQASANIVQCPAVALGRLSSAVCYQDAKAAFRWLEEAFGFEPLFVLLDAEGNLGHSEMTYGNSVVMVGNEWSDANKSPKSIGGKNSESIHVQLAEGEDLDAHCERARAAGAEVLMEPEMQFYGDRTYRARDPEGHIWTFSVTVKK
jgi:uncharacterized glyoxalase superfamily protein PhnB